ALLTRARSSFREELEADREPFACADTRALVELQLEGVITVAERHSLRAHLRHCSPCSTMARAIRSSRGKLAGLLVWPAELISRLAGAFSQPPRGRSPTRTLPPRRMRPPPGRRPPSQPAARTGRLPRPCSSLRCIRPRRPPWRLRHQLLSPPAPRLARPRRQLALRRSRRQS